jgi:hypothetical protein
MATWPATLPQSPLINGYNEVPEDARLVSEVDAGSRKIRNRYTAASEFVNENYVLTAAQYATLKSFYKTTLGNGAEEFTKENPITETDLLYRFTAPFTLDAVQFPFYLVTLPLEILPA